MTGTHSTEPAGERDIILDGLVNDWLDATAAIEKHQTHRDQLGQQIAEKLGVGGRHEIVDGVGVRVQAPAARFDAKKATQILSAEQLAAISESKPTAAMAKKMLPGILVEQLTVTTGAPSVRSI